MQNVFRTAEIYKYNLFDCITLLKTKKRFGVKRWLLFGFLPVLKSKYYDDMTEFFLFGFIPLVLRDKIRHTDYRDIEPGLYKFSNLLPFEADGLQNPEGWGCWSDGNQTSFYLKTNKEYIAEFDLHAFWAPGKERQTMIVYVNNCAKQKYVFQEGREIPRIMINLPKSKKLHIMFKYEDVKSPADLGVSEDNRKISIGFRTLEIKG